MQVRRPIPIRIWHPDSCQPFSLFDSLADFEILFDKIPLDKVSTSMTINATAAILLAMYIAVGKKQGVAPEKLRGTVQNDNLAILLTGNQHPVALCKHE